MGQGQGQGQGKAGAVVRAEDVFVTPQELASDGNLVNAWGSLFPNDP